jgi:hypothetical protein
MQPILTAVNSARQRANHPHPESTLRLCSDPALRKERFSLRKVSVRETIIRMNAATRFLDMIPSSLPDLGKTMAERMQEKNPSATATGSTRNHSHDEELSKEER